MIVYERRINSRSGSKKLERNKNVFEIFLYRNSWFPSQFSLDKGEANNNYLTVKFCNVAS